MAEIIHNGKTIQTRGRLPAIGSRAPDFKLTRSDLTDVCLASFGARRKILNIVPSLDTGVCAASVRRFDAEAADLRNVAVLTISNDLPFAQKRFCEAEGIRDVVTLSQMRSRDFGAAYGVEIVDGPLAGLLSRAVVVLDERNRVLYTEQVPEIEKEPSYERALAAALK
jgi:thiol peroxidase